LKQSFFSLFAKTHAFCTKITINYKNCGQCSQNKPENQKKCSHLFRNLLKNCHYFRFVIVFLRRKARVIAKCETKTFGFFNLTLNLQRPQLRDTACRPQTKINSYFVYLFLFLFFLFIYILFPSESVKSCGSGSGTRSGQLWPIAAGTGQKKG
jgi:hypothetical protein